MKFLNRNILIIILIIGGLCFSCKKTKPPIIISPAPVSYPYDAFTDTIMNFSNLAGGYTFIKYLKFNRTTYTSNFDSVIKFTSSEGGMYDTASIVRIGNRSLKIIQENEIVTLTDSNTALHRLIFSKNEIPNSITDTSKRAHLNAGMYNKDFVYYRESWTDSNLYLDNLIFYIDTNFSSNNPVVQRVYINYEPAGGYLKIK